MADADNSLENPEIFEKLNGYPLLGTPDFGRLHKVGPEQHRIFNFSACDITTNYSKRFSWAVTSSMNVQKFNERDAPCRSADDARQTGGNPRELPQGRQAG